MILQDTLDVASELADLLQRSSDEAVASTAFKAAGIVPEQSVFTVQTVEGTRFRVTVTRENA